MGEKTDKSVSKPWLFQKGQPSANPKGRPKGTFSLKTYAKKYLQDMTDEEKLAFMDGLPKDVIWKMAEGNPVTSTKLSGDGDEPVKLFVEFINGKPNSNEDSAGVSETI